MSGDPSAWQLTDHTIAEGDVLELKVDARITWAATNVQMTLYYDDNGTRVPAVITFIEASLQTDSFLDSRFRGNDREMVV